MLEGGLLLGYWGWDCWGSRAVFLVLAVHVKSHPSTTPRYKPGATPHAAVIQTQMRSQPSSSGAGT